MAACGYKPPWTGIIEAQPCPHKLHALITPPDILYLTKASNGLTWSESSRWFLDSDGSAIIRLGLRIHLVGVGLKATPNGNRPTLIELKDIESSPGPAGEDEP